MSAPELNILTAITGMPGTGKTWYIKDCIKETLKRRLDVKVLILIDFDSPIWQYLENDHEVKTLPPSQLTPIPIINIEDIPFWCNGEIHQESRIMRTNNSNYAETFRIIQEYGSNLSILIEEFSKCMEGSYYPKSFNGMAQDRKQKNFDITMAYHFIAEIPPGVVKKLDWIIIKKTAEKYQSVKNRILHPYLEEIMDLIRKSSNPYIQQPLYVGKN